MYGKYGLTRFGFGNIWSMAAIGGSLLIGNVLVSSGDGGNTASDKAKSDDSSLPTPPGWEERAGDERGPREGRGSRRHQRGDGPGREFGPPPRGEFGPPPGGEFGPPPGGEFGPPPRGEFGPPPRDGQFEGAQRGGRGRDRSQAEDRDFDGPPQGPPGRMGDGRGIGRDGERESRGGEREGRGMGRGGEREDRGAQGGPGQGRDMKDRGGPGRGGPGGGGPGRGGPESGGQERGGPGGAGREFGVPGGRGRRGTPTDPKSRAAHILSDAYRLIGEQSSEAGSAQPESAKEIAQAARTHYTKALAAFNAGNYQGTRESAEASLRCTAAARELALAETGDRPAAVAGLTPPPAVEAGDSREHAEMALNGAYHEILRSRDADSKGAEETKWLATATATYKKALAEFNDKKYEAAHHHARAAALIVSVVSGGQ